MTRVLVSVSVFICSYRIYSVCVLSVSLSASVVGSFK